MDRPLASRLDLARQEVRNFAYRVFPLILTWTWQRLARLQEHLVNNNNRSSSNPNNNLPPIPCSVALVQILAPRRRLASVRRASELKISCINRIQTYLRFVRRSIRSDSFKHGERVRCSQTCHRFRFDWSVWFNWVWGYNWYHHHECIWPTEYEHYRSLWEHWSLRQQTCVRNK